MRSFTSQQQISLAKRLAFLTRSGIPLQESIKLCTTFYKGRQKKMFNAILDDINQGISLSRSFSKRIKGINEFFITLVHRGEQTGTLSESFGIIVQEITKRQLIKRRLISALIYPLCISIMTVLLTVFLILIIFPKIKPLFLSMGTSLPWNTRLLINLSTFISTWWWLLVVLFLMVITTYFLANKLNFFRKIQTECMLRIPVISKIIIYKNLQTICSTLSIMLSSGTPLLESLQSLSIRNPIFEKSIQYIIGDIQHGRTFSQACQKHSRLFSQFFVEFIHITEFTGSLAEGFTYMSEYYDQQLEHLTKFMTTLFEPILMILMGIIVGFVALSMILPMYGLTQNLSSIH